MPTPVLRLLAALLAMSSAAPLMAQDDLASPDELGRRLATLAHDHGTRIAVRSLARTGGGRDLWAVTVGGPDADTRPAVLVVAGLDGVPLGRDLALRFVERLAADRTDSVAKLLNRVTFYIIPDASPDASSSATAIPLHASASNLSPYDDDRDGLIDEDPPTDLNGDGVISAMRVRTPGGRWLVDPADPRLLRLADAARGETGVYDLLVEGIDADGDGRIAEDGRGGVVIDRNFTFDYQAFTPGAGAHAVSEVETRAIADFCYDHQNIVSVVAFAPQANLLAPWKPLTPGSAGRSPDPTRRGVRGDDEALMVRVASLYREITGLKGEAPAPHGGSFVEWAYYHFGRPAFATPAWRLGSGLSRPDSAASRPSTPLADTLAWLGALGVENVWLPWTRIAHPVLKDRDVEVGGLRPYATSIPPARLRDSLAATHTAFLLALGGLVPRLEIAELRSEELGRGVRRVRATLVNRGFLPTVSAMGDLSQVPVDVKAELQLGRGQSLAAGRRVQLVGPIAGSGGSREITWLVVGDGAATLVLTGPILGRVTQRIELGR